MRGNRCLTGYRRTDAGGAIDDFERLVDAYQNRIYGVALRLTSSPDAAADLTQETFLRAFRGWKNFRKESQAYTWLYRILVNLNKDRIGRETRRRLRETTLTSEDGTDAYVDLPDRGPNPSQCAETGELRGILAKAMDDLQPGYKECVVLKDVEGLSYEQIAEVMGITVEAVRSRLARARQQLRQSLAPYLKA